MGFKDVMKSFLYETVEDDEFEEEEEVSTQQPISTTPASTIQPEVEPQPVNEMPATMPEPNVPAQPELYVEPQVVAQPQSGQFLNAIEDVVEVAEKEKANRFKGVRAQVNRANRNVVVRQDYTSIISPIYGDVSEDQKDATLVHDAINLTKPIDSSEMTTIISPIFGATQAPKAQKKAKSNVVKVDSKKKAAPRKEAEPVVKNSKESKTTDLASFLSRPASQSAKEQTETESLD